MDSSAFVMLLSAELSTKNVCKTRSASKWKFMKLMSKNKHANSSRIVTIKRKAKAKAVPRRSTQ